MKKNYNPFRMMFSYIFGTLLIIFAVLSFYLNIGTLMNFLNKITIGNLFGIVELGQTSSFALGIFNPIAMFNLFVYGFLIGWGIQSLVRVSKR